VPKVVSEKKEVETAGEEDEVSESIGSGINGTEGGTLNKCSIQIRKGFH
jgi:hypothetical protein